MMVSKHLTLLALILLPLAACSGPQSRKVLSFFFDGVPGSSTAPQARGGGMRQRITAPPPKAPARPAAPMIVSTHKPVAERQCRMCHQSNRGYYEPIGVDEKLCDRCHRELRVSQGWNHGPINLGTCLPCHRAHESPYPHLMDKPMPDLCLLCHKEDVERTPKYHQVANVNQCTACHDPHRTGVLKRPADLNDQTTGGGRINGGPIATPPEPASDVMQTTGTRSPR